MASNCENGLAGLPSAHRMLSARLPTTVFNDETMVHTSHVYLPWLVVLLLSRGYVAVAYWS